MVKLLILDPDLGPEFEKPCSSLDSAFGFIQGPAFSGILLFSVKFKWLVFIWHKKPDLQRTCEWFELTASSSRCISLGCFGV